MDVELFTWWPLGVCADVPYAPLHGAVGAQQPISRPLLKDVVIRQLKLAHAHAIIIADWKRIVPPVNRNKVNPILPPTKCPGLHYKRKEGLILGRLFMSFIIPCFAKLR